jgi:hypothetical protein
MCSQGIFSSTKYLRAVAEECGRIKFLLRVQEPIKYFDSRKRLVYKKSDVDRYYAEG